MSVEYQESFLPTTDQLPTVQLVHLTKPVIAQLFISPALWRFGETCIGIYFF